MRLQGRIALVTGAARGLGRAIALKLAHEGAIVLAGDLQGCPETLELIGKDGGQGVTIQLDVTDAASARAAVAEAVRNFGRLDILVNNAGINRDAMLHKLEPQQWDAVIAVNLTGVFNCLQPAATQMRVQQYGRIVNISSAAWEGNIGQANYAAAKAGVIGLTKTTARELAKFAVTCNAIAPGFIETDMTRGVPPKVWDVIRRSQLHHR
jgi:NAD(P)-dependent dehydrogenase (short-subunit alcohol dehydrogenase family)